MFEYATHRLTWEGGRKDGKLRDPQRKGRDKLDYANVKSETVDLW
jgi:hypothetical protein